MKKPTISVILPAYNEENIIIDSLDKIIAHFRTLKFISAFEVIVVDDGSTDKTYDKVREYTTQKNVVKLIKLGENKGKGAALKKGFSAASMEYIFFTDVDQQYKINEIDKFIKNIPKGDFIIGRRINKDLPLIRKIISKAYAKIVNLFFGLGVGDVECAFKLFPKDKIKNMSLTLNSFAIDLEILVKAKRKGYKIYEIPVEHFSRRGEKSKLTLRRILETTFDMFKLKWD